MAPPWTTSPGTTATAPTAPSPTSRVLACVAVLSLADQMLMHSQVVISFVLASGMTTAASILAMILDNAYDSKGQFTLRAPVTYVRERFLDTEWKRDYAWRPFLDPLIIGFGDQQLVTGYAVLLSGWIKVRRCYGGGGVLELTVRSQVAQNSFEVQGAHFVLILYICALSSSSHLAAIITLRKYFRKYKIIAKIRLTLVIVFAVCLFASMIAAICMPPTTTRVHDAGIEERSRVQRLAFLVPMLFILVGFSTAVACILYDPERKRPESRAPDASNSMAHVVHRLTDQTPPTPINPARHLIRDPRPVAEVCTAKGRQKLLRAARRRGEYVGLWADAERGYVAAAHAERVPYVPRGPAEHS
ncbi:hypothetical protein OPT61_g1947 [Boeremia exigua]|uniref:Uncharacterized protein n=1 Tax=Boeremia exigua TaxID=749465 RepID=A0ACC2INJ6_9PLEO|nr:hypothetical protein OPT61_g1947 [Boeremia exigua]